MEVERVATESEPGAAVVAAAVAADDEDVPVLLSPTGTLLTPAV